MFIKEINGSLVVRLQALRVSAVWFCKTEISGSLSVVAEYVALWSWGST